MSIIFIEKKLQEITNNNSIASYNIINKLQEYIDGISELPMSKEVEKNTIATGGHENALTIASDNIYVSEEKLIYL